MAVRRRCCVAAAVAAAFIAAGCSATDHSKDPLPPEPSQSSASSSPPASSAAPSSSPAENASPVHSSPAKPTGKPTTTKPHPKPTTKPSLSASEKNAIIKGYLRAVRVYENAVRDPGKNWRAAIAGTSATRIGVDNSLKNLALIYKAGEVAYGRMGISVRSVSLNEPTRATLRVCTDSSHTGLKDAKTGTVRSVGRAHVPATVVMLKVDGVWKQAAGITGQAGTC